MFPFLIILVAFGIATAPARADDATPTPDPRTEFADAVKKYQEAAANLKANAVRKAAASLNEATEEMRDEANEGAAGSATPSGSSDKTDKDRRRKASSGDGDTVFAAIPIVAIVFTFLYLIVRALMAPFTNRNKQRAMPFPPAGGSGITEEEAALMEKLQRTLAQMESRVESLETILIDNARTTEKYGTKL